jgi:hypothetical protein
MLMVPNNEDILFLPCSSSRLCIFAYQIVEDHLTKKAIFFRNAVIVYSQLHYHRLCATTRLLRKCFWEICHLFVVSVRVDSCTIWCEPQLYVHNTALSSLWKAHATTRTTNDLHTANWLRVDSCKEHESWRQCKFPRAEVMFYPTWEHSPLKESNEQGSYNA